MAGLSRLLSGALREARSIFAAVSQDRVSGVCVFRIRNVDYKIVFAIAGKTKSADGGNSVGIYQIRKIYVDDVNRLSGRRYTYADRKDPVKSREMVKIYLGYYGGVYTHTTGKAVTYDVLAAIHNGGPYGWRKSSTRRFQAKVRTAMLARSRFTAARR